MPASSLQRTSSSVSEMTLLVEQPGLASQEVFLQHGISLGRAASNTVCVDDASVEAIHARVLRRPDGAMLLRCESRDGRVIGAEGVPVAELALAPGTQFRLGVATITCRQRQTRTTVIVTDNPWQVRCPRCAESLVDVPKDLKACPHCQLPLVYFAQPPVKDSGRPGFAGWLPRKVGPYHVRGFVAEGGMGIVVRALHAETELPAAIKLLRGDLADDTVGQARFAGEVATLKRLKHPHVVRLQEAGREGHLAWLAMDWVQGRSLAGELSAAKKDSQLLSLDEIRNWLQQICAGLAYLHEQGLIHRDLKPGNILVAEDGVVRITDLGIARPVGDPAVTTMMTRTGAVLGTSGYMAPEQSEGQVLTQACDIYSLGVIWYEMLTGHLPAGGQLRWEEVRPDCPSVWRGVVEACLSAAPQERPAVTEVATALEKLEEPRRPRSKIFAAVAVMALAALALVITLLFVLHDGANEDLRKLIVTDIEGINKAQNEGQSTKKYLSRVYSSHLDKWLQAEKFGWPDGICLVGNCYEEGVGFPQDYAAAVDRYRKAAEAENPWGMLNLGSMYEEGHGVAKDETEAAKWYRKAAEAKNSLGMFTLGVKYVTGHGVPQDDGEAVRWFRKAVEAGNSYGMDCLGVMYAEGRGVSRDDAAAVQWYRKAAEVGNPSGMIHLGNMCAAGRGVAHDAMEAVKWFRKAAEAENPQGMANLGYMYAEGRGVTKDEMEAAKWYREAADAGNSDGMWRLGDMCLWGHGVLQSNAAALKWYRKAAEAGNPKGMYGLGLMYAGGVGVTRDEAEAEKWYRKAAQLGLVEAQQELRSRWLSW